MNAEREGKDRRGADVGLVLFDAPDEVRRGLLWPGLVLLGAVVALLLVPYGTWAYPLVTATGVGVGLVVLRTLLRYGDASDTPRLKAAMWWASIVVGIVGVGWATWQTISG